MKSSGRPTTPAHSHGSSLDGVRGQRVGVLQMLGHIRSVEAALGAGVGAHEHVLLGGVDGDHRAAHAVVDRPLAIVATRDDSITHREVAATDVDALAQPAVALKLGADERVETLTALVVTHDEDGLSAAISPRVTARSSGKCWPTSRATSAPLPCAARSRKNVATSLRRAGRFAVRRVTKISGVIHDAVLSVSPTTRKSRSRTMTMSPMSRPCAAASTRSTAISEAPRGARPSCTFHGPPSLPGSEPTSSAAMR